MTSLGTSKPSRKPLYSTVGCCLPKGFHTLVFLYSGLHVCLVGGPRLSSSPRVSGGSRLSGGPRLVAVCQKGIECIMTRSPIRLPRTDSSSLSYCCSSVLVSCQRSPRSHHSEAMALERRLAPTKGMVPIPPPEQQRGTTCKIHIYRGYIYSLRLHRPAYTLYGISIYK